MLPFEGEVTASVNPVATIASNALPPLFIISIPALDARLEVEETAPFLLGLFLLTIV